MIIKPHIGDDREWSIAQITADAMASFIFDFINNDRMRKISDIKSVSSIGEMITNEKEYTSIGISWSISGPTSLDMPDAVTMTLIKSEGIRLISAMIKIYFFIDTGLSVRKKPGIN